MRNFKMQLSTVLVLFLVSMMQVFSADAQTISNHLFGQNAWMPDSLGTIKYYGQLDSKWPEIKASGAQIIRFGGIGPDHHMPTKYQYLKMIDKIKANGMEPVVQVSFYNGMYTAAQAAEIVRYVNIEKGRGVKYWIIANEPDNEYHFTAASQLSWYLKSFASAMKAKDPTIKTIGPETAWYNSAIIHGLTTPGGPDDITGKDANGRFYIDYISFHMYSFGGQQTRAQVLSDLTAQYRYEWNLTELNSRLAACNSQHGRSGTSALKVAVTEANVGYINPSTDNLYGVGANSFVGGQFWSEFMAISMKKGVDFVNFWSVVEGNNTTYNIGFLDYVTGAKKPTYYHFQMVSQNFNGTFINGTDNQTNVKAFGCRNNAGQTVVMLLNQDQGTNFNYTVRLDGNAVSGTNALKVNVNSGIAKEYSGTINNQGSQVLVFDGAGNLVKKINYTLAGHAAAGLPPTVETFTATASGLTASVTPSTATAICSGSSITLKANTGTGITYQWLKNGVAIAGATASTLNVTTAGSYAVKEVLNSATSTSTAVNVTISSGVTASITAGSTTALTSGKTVVLTASAGTGYTYQWRKNGVAISGATSRYYTAGAAGAYTCAVSLSGSCAKVSNSISVTMSGSTSTGFVATINTGGAATTVAKGGNVWLKANTGTGITYQWKKNGYAIAGATGNAYNATTTGTYTVTESNGFTTLTSNAITITVGTTLYAKISPGGSTTVPAGGTLKLYANTGTNYTYQWKKNGYAITGATSPTYTVTTSGSYQLKITLGTTSAWSAPLTVTVGGSTARTSDTTNAGIAVLGQGMHAEGGEQTSQEEAVQQTYQFAEHNDSIQGNTIGAGGRKATEASRTAQNINKTGAGGRKSSSSVARTAETEMDSAQYNKMVNNETGLLSIKAFPNPTHGDMRFTITTVNTVQSQVKLELYNNLGQIVWSKTPIIENGYMNDQIELDGQLAAGDYFLRVREDQNVEVMKVCVIK
jgi:hypothetical protein